MALFGAIVAVGLGPAMWLGAQFGHQIETPAKPAAVTSEHSAAARPADKGGEGAGSVPTGTDTDSDLPTERTEIKPFATPTSRAPIHLAPTPTATATTRAPAGNPTGVVSDPTTKPDDPATKPDDPPAGGGGGTPAPPSPPGPDPSGNTGQSIQINLPVA
jgi:hypothetical protein